MRAGGTVFGLSGSGGTWASAASEVKMPSPIAVEACGRKDRIAAVTDPAEQPSRRRNACPPGFVAVCDSKDSAGAGVPQRWGQQPEWSRSAEDHPCRPELTEQARCPAGYPWRWQQQWPVANNRVRALTVSDCGAICARRVHHDVVVQQSADIADEGFDAANPRWEVIGNDQGRWHG